MVLGYYAFDYAEKLNWKFEFLFRCVIDTTEKKYF